MAVEMALKFGDGIRVNAIAPGFLLTEQNRDAPYNDRWFSHRSPQVKPSST